ncbi:hypothetical protein P19_0271 [Aeromonas phage P19]|uniref:Phage protein n=1 Tax=Aeromonas phage vB_AdhaM_G2 TaxID=3238786 RepID=A0AB39TZC5_9CAUD|nr:hypothetical protein P19_0271 [Aeromonas phage P19]
MKIHFKDTDAQYEFMCKIDANAAIADYMGMDTHDAISYEECGKTIIALVDVNGDPITVGEFDQWEAQVHQGEQQFFIIEE